VPSTDKPKFSRGTGEGLTTTQTRAILVKHFGEKLIKALEAKGLITIMDSQPSWAASDSDGAYHNGKSYLFASNLTPETVVATFIHELGGHKGFQELMTPTAYDSLMRQFNRLVNQGNPIALAAKERAEAAESTLGEQQDEYLPYLLTQQTTLNAGRIQQSSVAKVVEQVYRAVKAWLYRTLSAHGFDGVASKLLQPKDIALLAERMIREMGNWTNPSNNTKAKGSQLSQLNTPLDPVNTRNILDRLLRVFAPKADAMRDSAVLRVRVVKSFVDLPLTIQEEAKRQGSNGSDIKGVF
jgi:hypothetical protein